jgi:hypothetical protein
MRMTALRRRTETKRAQLMDLRTRAQLMDSRTRTLLMDTPMRTWADVDDVQEMDRRQHPGG